MTKRQVSRPGGGRGSSDLFAVLANSELAAFATDDEDRIVFWNHAAASLFGRPAGDALGRYCYDIVQGRDLLGRHLCYRDCPMVANRRIGEPAHGCEFMVPAADGDTRPVSVTILHLPAHNGNAPSSVHLVRGLDESGLLAELARAGLERESRAHPAGAHPIPPLTIRENEILRWVALGLQNKEVAQKLGISLATVRNHIHNILDKLQVHSKLEAVCLAYRSGWVTGEADEGRFPPGPVRAARALWLGGGKQGPLPSAPMGRAVPGARPGWYSR